MEIEKLKELIAKAESIILDQIWLIQAHNVQVESIDLSISDTMGYKYLTVDDVKIRVSI